jgi:hypothetical protein
MINALASAVLVWGTLAIAVFVTGFFIWNVWTHRQWVKEQKKKDPNFPF